MRAGEQRGTGPTAGARPVIRSASAAPAAPCPLVVIAGEIGGLEAMRKHIPADMAEAMDASIEQFRVAYDAVVELVKADREYEQARLDWDRATASHPGDLSERTWQQVACRFEAAVMRRAAALAKFGEA